MSANYKRTAYGVGYLGEGEYDTKHPANRVWRSMICRCYCSYYKDVNRAYDEATMCEEWHDYQTFSKAVKTVFIVVKIYFSFSKKSKPDDNS